MYFILLLIDIIWKCIEIDPNVITISINNPLKNRFISHRFISYMPLENSNNPNIKLFIVLLKGNVSFNNVTSIDINNKLDTIITSFLIVLFNDFE